MDLTEAEARRRFTESPSAVLATADADGRPHAVPVVHIVIGDHVYIAIDDKPKKMSDPLRLKRLRNIAANPQVCVLAEFYDEDWTYLWWVRADGIARVISFDDGPEGLLGAFHDRHPFHATQPPSGPVVDVEVTRWTGWAFSVL
jgi:PPOX class probable F420-dependent enzyme